MSTLNESVLSPNSRPRRASEITLADQIRFLLGRQATLGQAPPSSPRSTITVRRRLSRVHAANLPAIPLPIIKSSYFSTLAIFLVSLTGCLAGRALRKVDRDPRDVAHVVLENVQRDVGDRLDDFAVAHTGGTRAPKVRVGEFTTLHDDAAGELEDRIGSSVGRARPNRVIDFNLSQPDFCGHSPVSAQAVSAQVAFGD